MVGVGGLRTSLRVGVMVVCNVVAGCSGADGGSAMATGSQAGGPCVVGSQSQCTCLDGQVGVAVCSVSGLQGACECGALAPSLIEPASRTGGYAMGTAGGLAGAPDANLNLAGSAGAATGTAGVASPWGPDQQSGQAGTVDAPAAASEDDAPVPVSSSLAVGVRITEIAAYQPVKVPLVQNGETVLERNAPVIEGRQALIRVFVETLPGYSAQDISAELRILSAEGAGYEQIETQRISRNSEDGEFDSTFNFDVPAEGMTADARYSVKLLQADGVAGSGAEADEDARFPRTPAEVAELGTRSTGGPLRVMLIPYRFGSDGSNRMPDISDEQIDLYRRSLMARYPVAEIELEIHDPVTYLGNLAPTRGWEGFLDAHCALRADEDPDPKVLYYGVINPRESLREYGGGIVGISYLPGPAANFGRCSVGVGFPGEIASTTMAHELGHSLGLPHAPCGVSGEPYPYTEAKVGVWGYDRTESTAAGVLIDPDEAFDLMSYCEPNFISDYNYQKLFERLRYLNLQFNVVQFAVEEQHFFRVLQYPDGRHEVMGRLTSRGEPAGAEEARPMVVIDDEGEEYEATGYFLEASEEGAGLWLVPDLADLYGAQAHGQAAVLTDGVEVRLP